MINGEIYPADHSALSSLLGDTRLKIARFNALAPDDIAGQHALLDELLGSHGEEFHFNQPFRCDYGCNIHIGERFFANFNFTVLDEAEVKIGHDAFIGPNVSIYTACHPIDGKERRTRREWALPVTIGNDVWIGGSVTILPGVTLGDNVTVGAGSVVTHSFGDNVVIAGNPARVIRRLTNIG